MIRCRTLTEKSIIWFGKHEGLSLRQIIDLERYNGISYLAWCYFNNSKFGLNELMLNELNITENLLLEKPSKNPSFYYDWKSKNTTDEQRLSMYHAKNRNVKQKNIKNSIAENKFFSKSSMKNRNQNN